MLLLERNTTRAYPRDFLNLLLASLVAAPHSLYKAVAVLFKVCRDFVEIVSNISLTLSVFKSLFIDSVAYFFEFFEDNALNLVERYYRLFSVMACNHYALTVFNISRAYFDSYRNALHFVLGKLPSRRVLAVVNFSTAYFLQSVAKFICRLKYTLFVLRNRYYDSLNRCNGRRKNKSVVIAVSHNDCTDKSCCNAP